MAVKAQVAAMTNFSNKINGESMAFREFIDASFMRLHKLYDDQHDFSSSKTQSRAAYLGLTDGIRSYWSDLGTSLAQLCHLGSAIQAEDHIDLLHNPVSLYCFT